MTKDTLFHKYFEDWVKLYKRGTVRPITYGKYQMTLRHLTEIAPSLSLCNLDRREYQQIINKYAETHERQTVMDFHHHLKGAILDAIDERLIDIDPTRKVAISGKPKADKAPKFLNKAELVKLLAHLRGEHHLDWLILLLAKTGLRYAEALGLTPKDFDFEKGTLQVSKTWDYKSREGGFTETKNHSSKRVVQIDSMLNAQLYQFLRGKDEDEPVFVKKTADGMYQRMFNSTANHHLRQLTKKAGVPPVSIHGLRHTHASLLIYEGVSIQIVAKRLGHATTTTTQETYLHIIKELEDADNKKVVIHLAELSAY